MAHLIRNQRNLDYTLGSSSDKSIHLDGRSVGQRGRRVLGYPHEEHFGQLLDEEAPDPRRDFVGGRFAVADVEDDDGD